MIPDELARALEIRREAPDELVVETFLRRAGRTDLRLAASPGALAWIVGVAGGLANHIGYDFRDRKPIDLPTVAQAVAEAAVGSRKRSDAVCSWHRGTFSSAPGWHSRRS